jgi:hypothetical protein
MLRQSVLKLAVVAAICVPAASADARYADYMNLRCSVESGLARPGDPPWVNSVARYYHINLTASAVNGETLQIERRDADGPKLIWHRSAGTSVPATHYVLDITTGALFVSFDRFEIDGRKFGIVARRFDAPIRCSRSPFRDRFATARRARSYVVPAQAGTITTDDYCLVSCCRKLPSISRHEYGVYGSPPARGRHLIS